MGVPVVATFRMAGVEYPSPVPNTLKPSQPGSPGSPPQRSEPSGGFISAVTTQICVSALMGLL